MKANKIKLAVSIILSLGLSVALMAQDSQIYYSPDERPKIENLIGLELDGKELETAIDLVDLVSNSETIKDREGKQEPIGNIVYTNGDKYGENDDKNSIYIEVVVDEYEPEKEELLIRKGVVVNDPNITLYPIPANNYFNFESFDNAYHTLEIFDLTGKKHLQVDLNEMNSNRINLDNFNSGVYFVQFTSALKISTKKITIKK